MHDATKNSSLVDKILTFSQKIFNPNRTQVTGIDIGTTWLKLVQLKQSGDKVELTGMYMNELPAEFRDGEYVNRPEEFYKYMDKQLKMSGIPLKFIVLSLNTRSVTVRKIQLPEMPPDEFKTAVEWEAPQYLPYEADSYYLDFVTLPRTKTQQVADALLLDVLLVATLKSNVDFWVQFFNSRKLSLIRVTIDSLAIQELLPTDLNNFVLLDIGDKASQLAIFQDGSPAAQRSINTAGDMFTQQIISILNINQKEAEYLKEYPEGLKLALSENSALQAAYTDYCNTLVSEVVRTIDFFKMSNPNAVVDNLFLTGGASSLYQLADYFAQGSLLKVSQPDTFEKIFIGNNWDKKQLKKNANRLSVATGAALGGLGNEED